MATPFSLATIQANDGQKGALFLHDEYVLLAPYLGKDITVRSLIDNWDVAFTKLQNIADEITSGRKKSTSVIAAKEATVLSPILYPDKLLAVGANYAGHLKEMGLEVEKWPSMPFFMRPPKTSLVGPGSTIEKPLSTKQFDWECELAVVVGKRLRHASVEEAAAGIAGFSIGLDMSCRDLIPAPNELKVDLMRGKAQDTMAPCGPHFVPAAFVSNPKALRITLDVNGKQMMNSSTSDMMYSCEEQISVISEYMTLEPGDIIFTGSPPGSAGVHGGCWLQPGDRIRAEIENIGVMEVQVKT